MSENRPDRDEDLPLHDEAAAREKWRGGETILGKRDGRNLPASEVDHAAASDGAGEAGTAAGPRVDLRPPD